MTKHYENKKKCRYIIKHECGSQADRIDRKVWLYMKKRMENIKKWQVWCLFTLLCTIVFLGYRIYPSQAAPPSGLGIYTDAQTQVTSVTMRASTMTLSVLASVDSYQWETTDPGIVAIQGSDTSRIVTLQALAKGRSTISVTVKYTDSDTGQQVTQILACTVDVAFSVDEDPTYTHIRYIHNTDTRKALVMDYGEEISIGRDIGLVFGAASTAQWEVANTDIAEVLDNQTIKANGAGRTTLRVAYSDGGEQWLDEIYVYVRPQLSYEGDIWQENSGDQWEVRKGDYLTASMMFVSMPSVSANNKLVWAVYQEVAGTNTLVCDSLGKTGTNSGLGNLVYNSAGGGYMVNLRAGEYIVAFYVVGTYTDFDTAMAEDDLGCKPVAVSIRVKPEYDNKEVSIPVGGTYDLAEAFNISLLQMGNFTLTSTDSTNPYTNYGSFDSAKWIFEAENLGTAYMTVVLNRNMPEIGLNMGDTVYITVVVTESFTLNHSSYTMFVGQTLDLNGIIGSGGSTFNSVFAWSSSNSSCASVEGSGLTGRVTAKKKTDSNSPAIIRLYWTNDEGITKVATCSITVKESITRIVMNPASQSITVGEVFTIKTNATEPVNFHWFSSDTSVATVAANEGNMSASVTGVKAGTAVITVMNLDNNVTATCIVSVMPALTSLSIDKGETYSVSLLQENIQMKAVYTPTVSGYTPSMNWTSSDTTVATIDNTGWITLRKSGETTIYVEPTFNPNHLLAKCVLTVLQPATDIELETTDLTLEVGESENIQYKVTPANSTSTITWSVMHENIATVDENGLVTAVAGGSTTVMATIPLQGGIYKQVACRVNCIQGATGIAADKTDITLNVGEMQAIQVTFTPDTVTERTLKWESRDSKIASVKDGIITGVSEGETQIIVQTTATGKQPTQTLVIHVSVRDRLQSISVDPEEKTVTKGKTFKIEVTYNPDNAANKDVTWESSDEEVASVNANGKVKGLKGGVALITCTADDGGYVALCRVKVREVVTSITLNKTSAKLPVKKTLQLTAKVESNFATNQKLTWSSSKPGVASINKKGLVTGKKVGTTVIKCKANDKSGEVAKCTVRVVNPVKAFTLSDNYMTLSEGRSKTIKAKVSPANATIKKIVWTSSDTNIAIVSTKGKVTGIAEGTCVITGTVKDGSGKKATCTVKVTPLVAASSVVVAQSEMTVVKGTRFGLNITVLPTNHTDTVSYSSDNKMVCTVNGSGTVTALRAGTATITIMTGSGKTNTVTVRVVALNKSSINMRQYDTETIWVDGVDSGVTWYSANPAIATVENGTITGKKKGVTYVYATVNGCKLACKVRIRNLKKRT